MARYSSDSNDAGFYNFMLVKAKKQYMVVTVDGYYVPAPVVADEDEGFVIALEFDNNGNISRTGAGEPIRKLIYGVVKVELWKRH